MKSIQSIKRLSIGYVVFASVLLSMLYGWAIYQSEWERLNSLRSGLARSVEGELLIQDDDGLSYVLDKLKNRHDLASLTIQSAGQVECSLFDVCAIWPLNVSAETYLVAKMNYRLAGIPFWIGVSFFVLSMILVFAFSRLIEKNLVSPVRSLAEEIDARLGKFLSGKEDKILIQATGAIRELETLKSGLVASFAAIKDSLSRQKDAEMQAQKAQAVAQVTQMLAHDVRKPFTLVKGLIGLLEASPNHDATKDLLAKFTPEINRVIASANGMISDVMEVGSESTLTFESRTVETLVSQALRDSFTFEKDAEIQLEYEFSHCTGVDVDERKVGRVFGNILTNALQAMKRSGRIWFKTREVEISGGRYVEICIGNSNSHIRKEDLNQLFDAFFTKNKRGGTGLGLAIAKKIVEGHGGTIECRSSEDLGVEFYIVLPASSVLPAGEGDVFLPASVRDLVHGV